MVRMDVAARTPLKEFRIAPLGHSLIAYGVGCSALSIGLVCINQEANPTINAITVGVAAASIVGNVVFGSRLIKRQQSLYRRLEASLAQDGYNERIFAVTTDEWCNRQTARIVCEAAGVLPEYEELCEARRDTAALTHIPHL